MDLGPGPVCSAKSLRRRDFHQSRDRKVKRAPSRPTDYPLAGKLRGPAGDQSTGHGRRRRGAEKATRDAPPDSTGSPLPRFAPSQFDLFASKPRICRHVETSRVLVGRVLEFATAGSPPGGARLVTFRRQRFGLLSQTRVGRMVDPNATNECRGQGQGACIHLAKDP